MDTGQGEMWEQSAHVWEDRLIVGGGIGQIENVGRALMECTL